jgi:N,N'-diacetyllegionaminate synthase
VSRPAVLIHDRPVGEGHPCFVIAEAGVNHGGDLDRARRLVDAAARAGADAVKFQTFQAGRLVVAAAPKAAYQERVPGTALEMLRALELDEPAHRTLQAHCRDRGILFLSSPFEEASADLLERLGLPAFKLPSGELTNLPFLDHVARKGRPVLLSTGMATLGEVERALAALAPLGPGRVVLLHCVSSYPARPEDANLRAMATLARNFQVPVGYSDHTPGLEVALAAVALGAAVLEKHLTLDRTLPGPDQAASLEPGEFQALVAGVRTVESALGHGRKEPAPSELELVRVARKSVFAARDLARGTVLEPGHLVIKRPGTGLPPECLPALLGRTLRRDLPGDAPVGPGDVE